MIWGNGAMIAEVAGTQTATPEYRLLDHLGSLVAETDNSGNVTGSNVFLPFGQLVSSTTNDSFQFTGLEQDTENSSDHAWFRNLSTEQSRWLRPDPYLGSYDLANPQSLNRYAYVLNNPLAFVDPSGLDPQYCTWSASDGTLISSFCSTTGSITVDGGISGFGGSMGGRPGLGLLMAPGSNRPGPGGGITGPPSSVAPSKTPQQTATQYCQQHGQLSFNIPFTNIPVTIGVSATLFGSFSSTNDIGFTFPPSAGASFDITVGAPQGPYIPVQVGSGKNLSIGTFLTPSGPRGFSGSFGPSIGSPVTISPTVTNACGLRAGGG